MMNTTQLNSAITAASRRFNGNILEIVPVLYSRMLGSVQVDRFSRAARCCRHFSLAGSADCHHSPFAGLFFALFVRTSADLAAAFWLRARRSELGCALFTLLSPGE